MADVRETVDKKYSWDDVLNLLKTIDDNREKRFKELRGVIKKSFDEIKTVLDEGAEVIDTGFNKLKDVLDKQNGKWGVDSCQLKENTKIESKQVSGNNVVNNGKGIINNVSSCDSGDNNDDDTFTDNSVSLSTDEIIYDEVSENSENIWVNHNEDTGKCSENINNADKLKENGLKQVSSSDSGEKNDDTVTKNSASLSTGEIKNEVSEVNTNNNQKEVSLHVKQVAVNMAVSYTHLDVYKRQI